MQKICSTCKAEKTIEGFSKDKYKPDGLTSSCKACLSDRWKKYKEANHEKLRDLHNEYNAKRRQERMDDPEKVRQEDRENYQKTKDKRKLYDKNYRERNSELVKLRAKERNKRNKAENSVRNKAYRIKNKEKIQQKIKDNAGAHAATAAKRRASKLKATPEWLTKDQLLEIKLLYLFVAARRKITGLDLEVDHIIPLQGENVCGLHVPWNLQVLTASENASKGNRYKPEE